MNGNRARSELSGAFRSREEGSRSEAAFAGVLHSEVSGILAVQSQEGSTDGYTVTIFQNPDLLC